MAKRNKGHFVIQKLVKEASPTVGNVGDRWTDVDADRPITDTADGLKYIRETIMKDGQYQVIVIKKCVTVKVETKKVAKFVPSVIESVKKE